VRAETSNALKKCTLDKKTGKLDCTGALDKVRVALNYVLAKPDQEIRFVPGRDVFRVREVLTMQIETLDFSILQLLEEKKDANGNDVVVEQLDPMYQPVTLWDPAAIAPPMGIGQYRQGAAIGVGVRLPQKISISRSTGWGTDPQFAGVNIRADLFPGNSGGAIYDVETASLVGVVHSEFEHQLYVKCPAIPDTKNPWPICPTVAATPPFEAELPAFTLTRVPEFDFTTNPPVSRGCSQWLTQTWPPEQIKAFTDFIMSNFALVSAQVDPGATDKPQIQPQDATGVSIQAVRDVACTAAYSTDTFATAVTNATQAVIDLGIAARGNDGCKGADLHSFTFCPSATVVGGSLPGAGDPPLFNTSLTDAAAAQILGDSILCKGTLADTTSTKWSQLPEIKLENGRETSVHGTIKAGKDYFEVRTNDTGTPDALYRIKTDSYTVLYADTFSGGAALGTMNPGTDFDTVLFVMEPTTTAADPQLVPSSWQQSTESFDDSHCDPNTPGVSWSKQSQLVHILQPGKQYILGVTGFAQGTGKFNLHVQSVPAPRSGSIVRLQDATQTVTDMFGTKSSVFRSIPFVQPGTAEENCTNQNGAFDPACQYNVIPQITCQGNNSGEFGFISVSCPSFQGGQFRFQVDGSGLSSAADDPVAAYWEGHQQHSASGYVCSDDSAIKFSFWPLFSFTVRTFNADIGDPRNVGPGGAETTALTEGAGVRAFYAHQFQPFMNWQNLGYTLKLPQSAVNDIWTR